MQKLFAKNLSKKSDAPTFKVDAKVDAKKD
jgi:hypothetical protein